MAKSQEPKLFDYGLDAAQEERAQRLHQESIIIDMMYHGPAGEDANTEDMRKQVESIYESYPHDHWRSWEIAAALPMRMAIRGEFPAYKEWWGISGVTSGNREIGLAPPTMDRPEKTLQTLTEIALELDHLDWMVKARSADDIRRAKAEGKLARFISSQNTLFLGQDLDNLNMFHDFGLNVLQLTYNSMNLVAAGCTERGDVGVSSYGIKFIKRMNELGIIVDTGHCGRQTTLDACEISKQPVIASHTAAQGVYYHARGKSDEEFEAIAKTGGVIGIVVLPIFLSGAAEVTMEHYLDHFDYIVKLVGHKHVGLGSDGPMQMSMSEQRMSTMIEKMLPGVGFDPEEDQLSRVALPLKGLSDYREFINITRGLVSRGYSDEQIKDILGGNWLRVMEAVWK